LLLLLPPCCCCCLAAVDEKSTFERLMAGYCVNKQPLLQPRRLTTLTPMDQQVRKLSKYCMLKHVLNKESQSCRLCPGLLHQTSFPGTDA
jgi:hypothetical protein